MTTAIGAIAPVIKREGAELEATALAKLVHLRVERSAGLTGRATMRFVDNGYTLSAGDIFALGKKIDITVPDGGSLLSGTVTGINLEQSSRGAPELVVVVDDAGYKLARGTQVTTYLNGTYDDVVRKIAGRHGMRADVKATGVTAEYVLQAGTDLAFLDMITERLGYVWFVDDGPTLVVKPFSAGAPAATLTLGEDLQQFSVRASGLRPTEVKVHGWNPDVQDDLVDQNPSPRASAVPELVKAYAGNGPTNSLTAASTAVADARPLTNAEAKTLATAYYEEWSAAAVVARGTADVSGALKPGATVQVKDAGPASGKYVVTSVEHIYDSTGFTTRFVSGPRRPSGLVDTLGAPAPDPGFAVSGLIIAIVTDCTDPDSAGRVKVRYTGVGNRVESPWARVVTLGAGPARGAVFSPEVNDEVLVGFEHGDTRRPVVLGGLYSKKNTLPTGEKFVDGGNVKYRRITSRKNHILELADGDDPASQHLLLQLGTAQHKLRLGADRFDIEVAQGKPITIKAGEAKFDISASGDVTIEGTNISIKAKGNLDLEGVKTTAKGTGQAIVQGAQVQVKADGVGSVEASGPLTLKGAVVAIN